MSSDKLVFSTNKQIPKKNKQINTYEKSAGHCKIRIEKKGRRGKCVTILYNLPFDLADVKLLKKELQDKLGCGATFKKQQIEIQGDKKQDIQQFFQKKKWSLKG